MTLATPSLATDRLAAAGLAADDDVEGFWRTASDFEAAGLPPEAVVFEVGREQPDLFAGGSDETKAISVGALHSAIGSIPDDATALLSKVILHADADRHALAYRILRRLRATPHLLSLLADPDIVRARAMEKSVRRDMHKMTAFVRFRDVTESDGEEAFVAWFEPQHHIVRATAPFFVKRFASMRWTILTPRRTVRWDGVCLSFAPGASKADAPRDDAMEDVWRTYYASTFNPARLKVKAMQAQMPKKYWHNLPEADMIKPLIRAAQERSQAMIASAPTAPRKGARPYAPPAARDNVGADELPAQIAQCTRCPLHLHATQAVVGDGPADAALMIVGEQPGDQEDLAGKPFVGPAGRLLDEALKRSGIARETCFLTNAVKHFKFEPRGKRRLHKTPSASEIDHCRWWLGLERALVRPALILALGATAARGVLGEAVAVSKVRSRFIPLDDGGEALVTVHPAFLLRLTDPQHKRDHWRAFMADFTMVRERLAQLQGDQRNA